MGAAGAGDFDQFQLCALCGGDWGWQQSINE
jgi:hypothetical protein